MPRSTLNSLISLPESSISTSELGEDSSCICLRYLCVGCGGVPAQGNAVRPDGIVRGILHVQGVVIRAGRPSAQLYAGRTPPDIRRGIALLLGDQGERGGPVKELR